LTYDWSTAVIMVTHPGTIIHEPPLTRHHLWATSPHYGQSVTKHHLQAINYDPSFKDIIYEASVTRHYLRAISYEPLSTSDHDYTTLLYKLHLDQLRAISYEISITSHH